MTDKIENQQILSRLQRQAVGQTPEVPVIASPGGQTVAWPIKIKSLSSYNTYNVRAIMIGAAGSLPLEIGSQVEAVNLAESFLSNGTLSVGSYAVMHQVGEKNVFYANP